MQGQQAMYQSKCDRALTGAFVAPRLKESKAWHLPVALVKEQMLFAQLWRKCQPATSVLVVLVLYAPLNAGQEWSEWFRLDYECLARLSGVSERSVATAFRTLRDETLIQTQCVRSSVSAIRTPQRYRINWHRLHVRGRPFLKVQAPLVTSGDWSSMPSIAARHLWIVEQAVLPIRNRAGFLSHLENRHVDDPEARYRDIQEAGAPSNSRLAVLSGLSRAAVSKLRTAAQLWEQTACVGPENTPIARF
jgi:hypothetical protein